MKNKIYLFCILLILFSSCNQESKKNSTPKSDNSVSMGMPAFDADSAFHFVKAQTDFGPRVPNSVAHQECGIYLVNKLLQYCDTVFQQDFTATAYDGNKLKSKNIIGSFAPEKQERIILAAHWDSRPFADHDPNPENREKPIDGANDGASGVGVLLEIARQLQLKAPNIGVDIIFFDAEDYGTPSGVDLPGDWWCLGSQYWAKNPHISGYQANYGILLDMVGNPEARFLHEGFSIHYAQNVVAKVWGNAYKLGYKEHFVNSPSNPITDDHYYINKMARIPMIDIIHQDQNSGTGFHNTWHTVNDNIANIDPEILKIVGTTLLSVVYE